LKNPEFLAKLKGMAQKMKEGGEPTKEEMKTLLPKDAQEGMASMLMDQMKAKVGDKPGDIAAAMLSGKAPNDVTAADITSDSKVGSCLVLVKGCMRLLQVAKIQSSK
jgi:hypothetical protein